MVCTKSGFSTLASSRTTVMPDVASDASTDIQPRPVLSRNSMSLSTISESRHEKTSVRVLSNSQCSFDAISRVLSSESVENRILSSFVQPFQASIAPSAFPFLGHFASLNRLLSCGLLPPAREGVKMWTRSIALHADLLKKLPSFATPAMTLRCERRGKAGRQRK